MREALITIDGVELSPAESMTVRVALSSFASHLCENGLGTDKTGKVLTVGYLKAVASVTKLIYEGGR